MRFDFSISWTSVASGFSTSRRRLRLPGVGEQPADSSPTLRMMVPASSESGLRLVEHDLALEALAEGDLELAEQDAVAVLEAAPRPPARR